jgi:hypothetical protein
MECDDGQLMGSSYLPRPCVASNLCDGQNYEPGRQVRPATALVRDLNGNVTHRSGVSHGPARGRRWGGCRERGSLQGQIGVAGGACGCANGEGGTARSTCEPVAMGPEHILHHCGVLWRTGSVAPTLGV